MIFANYHIIEFMDIKTQIKKILNSNLVGKKIINVTGKIKKEFRLYKIRRKVDTQKLRRLKNTKIGKRCFIVGNGPSLNIADLERIKNEDSFAVNRIYKIFAQTNWRPTFYCSQDTSVLDEIEGDIKNILDECEGVFLNSYIARNKKNIVKRNNLYYFYLNTERYYPQLPRFSQNVCRQIFEGFTVAYASIQLAVYMGYSEIYLIGTDHSYNVNKKQDGSIEKNDGTTNYMKGLEGKLGFPPQLENSTLAFRKANQICKEKGIIIKNATRGGKLEEFERVDFDDLF